MNNQNINKNILESYKNMNILKIQEDERQRIAMELHDTSLQTLAHVVHQVELANIYMDQDVLKAKLELAEVKQNIKSVIEEIRNTIFNLRPMSFDDLGIEDTIQRYIEYVNKNHDFEIHTDIYNIDTDNELILLNTYRIIQECISNAIKHSGGNKIILKCGSKNHICKIEIEDNGKGFVEGEYDLDDEKHYGLSIIKKRVFLMGGNIKVDSVKEKGTKITIEIPLIVSEG